ncbi:Sec-independent protein translocase TatB [Microbacterium terricola]|nr:Sec-independent protein translocase TatB [Microbacterium terricola]UYK41219.1 Sec-independent protein translocase TatB [Microbacterium terricola]
MFNGITIEKLLLLGVIAALIIGPERLPRYAEGLARLTQRARDFLTSTKTRVKEEMGEDFDDVDWRSLDPRQYDPRRIIRQALLDDAPVPAATAAAVKPSAEMAPAPAPTPFRPGGETPFDNEAT